MLLSIPWLGPRKIPISIDLKDSRTSSTPLIHGLEEDFGPRGVVTCPLHSIARVEERRYELRDLALEIFFDRLSNVPPILIAFRSKKVIWYSADQSFLLNLFKEFVFEFIGPGSFYSDPG